MSSEFGDLEPEEYIKNRHLELGRHVCSKYRIYLDQKFWIYLRDAKYGNNNDEHQCRLYDIIRSLVQKGLAICPISFSVYAETIRQGDKQSRIRTAQVIDELSGNVTLKPFVNLNYLEIAGFFKGMLLGKEHLYPREYLAWDHIFFFMGVPVPKSEAFDKQTNAFLQKAFYEQASQTTFTQIMEKLDTTDEMKDDDTLFQQKLTAESKKHDHEFNSYKQVLLNEVAGTVDHYRDEIITVIEDILIQKYGAKRSESAIKQLQYGQEKYFENAIYQAFKANKITTELPCIHIPASVHAGKRYRRDYYNKGDLQDLMHARVALPYCNLFLTEKNLGNLITNKPLKIDKVYGCSVVWQAKDALEIIEEVFN